MAAHIALIESGLHFELERVNLADKITESGEDFNGINAKGYVPALLLDNGEILTEAAVTLQYIADQVPDSDLAPAAGTIERYRMLEWLNFISTEFHKTLGALFNPGLTSEWRNNQIEVFYKRCEYLTGQLSGKQFISGDKFTIADAYLFTIVGWAGMHQVKMEKWAAINAYMDRIAARPAVLTVLKAEGLIADDKVSGF
jgi:glutathione S-transferase